MERFQIGDIVQHFKREFMSTEKLEQDPNMYLYKIVAFANHTETNEPLVIYQALYGDKSTYARPEDMFCGKVDTEKYPTVQQYYRLEVVGRE